MEELQERATRIAAKLTKRGETLSTVESSGGGLISAAFVAVPGASAFYLGGCAIYTAVARNALLGLPLKLPEGMRSASEPYAALLADTMRARCRTTWALTETGASGPTGNSYGDSAGHTCCAVSGPQHARTTLETGLKDRTQNMLLFAIAALTLFEKLLDETAPAG
jgi:nicotinamide-nucleotide amidase